MQITTTFNVNFGLGIYVVKTLDERGLKHSLNDNPSEVIFNWLPKGCSYISESSWHDHDQEHRDCDKPSRIRRHLNGQIEALFWRYNGLQHRDYDQPSVISYYEDGSLHEKRWYFADEPRRLGNGPNIIQYEQDGSRTEKWSKSREDLKDPYHIEYDKNNNIRLIKYEENYAYFSHNPKKEKFNDKGDRVFVKYVMDIGRTKYNISIDYINKSLSLKSIDESVNICIPKRHSIRAIPAVQQNQSQRESEIILDLFSFSSYEHLREKLETYLILL